MAEGVRALARALFAAGPDAQRAREELEAMLHRPADALHAALLELAGDADPYVLSVVAVVVRRLYVDVPVPGRDVQVRACGVAEAYMGLLFAREAFDSPQSVYKVCSIVSMLCLKYWELPEIKELVVQAYAYLATSPVSRLKALQFYKILIDDFSYMALYTNFEVLAGFRRTVVMHVLEAAVSILTENYTALASSPADVVTRELVALALTIIPECMEFGTSVGPDGDRMISMSTQALDDIFFREDDPTYIVGILFDMYAVFADMPELSSKCLSIVVALSSLSTVSVDYDKYIVNRASILTKVAEVLVTECGLKYEENVLEIIHFLHRIPRPFASPSDLLQLHSLNDFTQAAAKFSNTVLMSDRDISEKLVICKFWASLAHAVSDHSSFNFNNRAGSFGIYPMGDLSSESNSVADIIGFRCNGIQEATQGLILPLFQALYKYIYDCYCEAGNTAIGGKGGMSNSIGVDADRNDNVWLKQVCDTKNAYVGHLVKICRTYHEAKDLVLRMFTSTTTELFQFLANMNPEQASASVDLPLELMQKFIQFTILFNVITLSALSNLISISRALEDEDFAQIIGIFFVVLRDVSQSSIFRPLFSPIYTYPGPKTLPQRIFFNTLSKIIESAYSGLISINGHNRTIIEYLFITPDNILTFDDSMISNNSASQASQIGLSPAAVTQNLQIAATHNSESLKLLLKLMLGIKFVKKTDSNMGEFYINVTRRLFEDTLNLFLMHLAGESRQEVRTDRECFVYSDEILKNLVDMALSTSFSNKSDSFRDILPMLEKHSPNIYLCIQRATYGKLIRRTHTLFTGIIVKRVGREGLSSHLIEFHKSYYTVFNRVVQGITSQLSSTDIASIIYFVKGLTGVAEALEDEYYQMPLIKFFSFYIDYFAVISENVAKALKGPNSVEYSLLKDILTFVTILLKSNLDNMTSQLSTDIHIANSIRMLVKGIIRIVSSLAVGLKTALYEGAGPVLTARSMIVGSDSDSKERISGIIAAYEPFEYPVKKLISLGIEILNCSKLFEYNANVEQLILNILEISNIIPVFVYMRKPKLLKGRSTILGAIGAICPTVISKYPQDEFNKLWDFCINVLFDGNETDSNTVADFLTRLLKVVSINKVIFLSSSDLQKIKLYIELNEAIAYDSLDQMNTIYTLLENATPKYTQFLTRAIELALLPGSSEEDSEKLQSVIMYSYALIGHEVFMKTLGELLISKYKSSLIDTVLASISQLLTELQPSQDFDSRFPDMISQIKSQLKMLTY